MSTFLIVVFIFKCKCCKLIQQRIELLMILMVIFSRIAVLMTN
jgi:hypothetical protein